MKRFYHLALTLFCTLMVAFVSAQEARIVEVTTDPTNPTDLSIVIMGDTMPTGERVDNNTIYRLENGQGKVYFVSSRLENTSVWPLQIEAADPKAPQGMKPVITRIPNDAGDYPAVIWSTGNVTLKGLWMITGETTPDGVQSWGQTRFYGAGSRVIVQDCIIDKDRGGALSTWADSIKVYVDNCVFRNGGNRFILEGNGRGFDSRGFALDTLIVTNSVYHNMIDRVFRSLGNVIPHNYIEFDHNTVFNQFGRHGFFSIEQVHEFKFTNNLCINPDMLGASPRYADEQNSPDNEVTKLFVLDTLVDPTNITMSNNNIFWTDDVKAIWAKHDTVSQPPVFSDLFRQALGDTTGAYFSEVIELNNVPIRITEYLDDLYANPMAEDMFDHVVQDVSLAGTDFDNGNLFDFLGAIDGEADWDPCYDVANTMSGTAATDGGPIGALTPCGLTSTSVYDNKVNESLGFLVSPNPIQSTTNFSYEIETPGLVRLSIYDVAGRMVESIVEDYRGKGSYNVEWRVPAQMPNGTYIARLQTQQGQMATVIMLTK
jgi:hypothetical protein